MPPREPCSTCTAPLPLRYDTVRHAWSLNTHTHPIALDPARPSTRRVRSKVQSNYGFCWPARPPARPALLAGLQGTTREDMDGLAHFDEVRARVRPWGWLSGAPGAFSTSALNTLDMQYWLRIGTPVEISSACQIPKAPRPLATSFREPQAAPADRALPALSRTLNSPPGPPAPRPCGRRTARC
jgi:hypothetical protein